MEEHLITASISCAGLAELIDAADGYCALFDVRERGEYNQCHIPTATSLPRSQIEFRAAELMPEQIMFIALYDDDDGERAHRAARTFKELGYAIAAVLERGLAAWKEGGYETVSGVNVPSKAFGEKVHQERQLPDLSPEELKQLIDRGGDPVIVDVRTPEEYGRFCIPGAINVPGGDLIHWAEELRNKRNVIINCAGRTRSIIGTAGLRRLGLTNVRALRNGTMGWVLAGLELESKPSRTVPVAPKSSRASALRAAKRIAAEEKIDWILPKDLRARLKNKKERFFYLIDVRSETEFASGHIAGSINVPGGQAVQRADDYIATRNAFIIFISNDSARAVMAAYWYSQMRFYNVAVLKGGLKAWKRGKNPLKRGAPDSVPLGLKLANAVTQLIDAAALREQLENKSLLILDVGSSVEFEAAHIPGARWISRGWIDIKLPELFPNRAQSIVLTCPDGMQSTLAARMLVDARYRNISVLKGGIRAWIAAGLATADGSEGMLCEPNDRVLSPSIRGDKEEMQEYLDWELRLKH